MPAPGLARVRVRGLAELRRALRAMGDDLPRQLRETLRRAGAGVASDARGRAPRRSGRLAGRVTARATQLGARVGSTLPYAPVIEFGGVIRHHGHGHSGEHLIRISARPFVQPAIDARAPDIVRDLERDLVSLARRVGWEVP